MQARVSLGPAYFFMKKLGIAIGCFFALLALAWIVPLPSGLQGSLSTSRLILDRNGQRIASVSGDSFGTPVRYVDLPNIIVDAVTSVEDRTFWKNPGLSLRGLTRALLIDVQSLSFRQGGSTITQQLIRITLKPKKRTVFFKMREMWLALKLSASSTKESVLERYLSTAYFGQRAYGIVDASRTYFDQDISRLSLSQSALLVGLINAPTSLNPYKNKSGAIARRDLVLRSLLAQRTISEQEYSDAISEEIVLRHGAVERRAPHVVAWLLSSEQFQLEANTPLRTTLDLDLQTEAENIVRYQLEKLEEKNVTSSAVVVLSVKTGDILAMVGSADFSSIENDGQVNIALAKRQPGSALKPFTYALALENGMTPATTIADVESQFFTAEGNPYIPRNYDFDHHGLVRLRSALANSYNISAVRILEKVGVATLLQFLQSTGITTLTESPEHYGLALTLGDGEVTLLELASAYGIFPRGGRTLIPKILQSDVPSEGTKVLSTESAWLIADILSDNLARLPEFGSSSPLNFDYPVAVKTGTTRNSRDNWTVGFTPSVIVGVWVGNADNSPMKGTSGVTGAGPIFHDVMEATRKYQEESIFSRPSSIIDREICAISGKRPTPLCRETIVEHFALGTEPKSDDDIYQELAVDTRNNLRASIDCPSVFTTKKVFTVFPQELRLWAKENGWNVPPDTYSPLCSAPSTATSHGTEVVKIITPADGTSVLLDPLIPDDSEQILLSALAPAEINDGTWYIDGKKISTAHQPNFLIRWKPELGSHTVQFSTASDDDSIHIEILSK